MNYITPQGFRDVLADEALEREQIVHKVTKLLMANGYLPIETPTLESMAVMQAGGRVPASPFKFFDAQGSLVTMRPDVTLQVARMCATRLDVSEEPLRLRYTQRVFRETEGQATQGAREKTQIGIEYLGQSGVEADAEVVRLFVQSLEAAGVEDFTLSLATVGVLRALLSSSTAPESWKDEVLQAFHQSNFVRLEALCNKASVRGSKYAASVWELSQIHGGHEAIEQARSLTEPFGCADALDGFEQTYNLLEQAGIARRIVIDFSVVSSFDYYTGMVFEAFTPGLGEALGSGGRYDAMLENYGSSGAAAGFAFYLEQVQEALNLQAQSAASLQDGVRKDADKGDAAERAGAADAQSDSQPQEVPLRIAIPKGSLNPETVEMLEGAGLDVTGLAHPGRQLVLHNRGVDYIIVRPSDAPVFVQTGAADCGICGEDSLIESDADVVELVDLRFGACRFVVAQEADSADAIAQRYSKLGVLRVATKYPRIALDHFAKTGQQVEIVQLHGNIELGPLTGLSDCIVDITATGTTLRENKLVVTDEVMSSTARFFSNVCSLRTDPRVRDLAARLKGIAADKELSVIAGKVE